MKTKIEWCDLSLNPVKGMCPKACSYCYARRLYKRFKWNPVLREDHSVFFGLPQKPSRIFVGSTMELFGPWIPDAWLKTIFIFVSKWPQHTFIFLTKQPFALKKWSPFPKNVWVGCSATNTIQLAAHNEILRTIEAPIKFISLEPLLGWEPGQLQNTSFIWKPPVIQWLIIGRKTPANIDTIPDIKWIKEIVEACDKLALPVFLKDNLRSITPTQIPLFNKNQYELRQEFPK